MHSGDVMEYVVWTVSDGFKYSLTESNAIDKTIGFALADSILINYESVMYIIEFLWTISFLRTLDSNKLKGFFYPGNAVSGEPTIGSPSFSCATPKPLLIKQHSKYE